MDVPRTYRRVLVQVRGTFFDAADSTHLLGSARVGAWNLPGTLMLQIPRTYRRMLVQVRGTFFDTADSTHLLGSACVGAWDLLGIFQGP
jgi:hypothetical protein